MAMYGELRKLSPETIARWRNNPFAPQAAEWLKQYKDPVNNFGYTIYQQDYKYGNGDKPTVLRTWTWQYKGMSAPGMKKDDQDLVDFCRKLGWNG